MSRDVSAGGQALLLAGAVTMILELLCARRLAVVVGSDLEGISVTVALFLVASAVGSALSGRRLRPPRRWILLALGGAILSWLWIDRILPPLSDGWSGLGFLPLRLLAALPVALPAYALSGLVVACFGVEDRQGTGMLRRAGRWFAAIDIGSAAGALATPLLLLPLLGSAGTLAAAFLLLGALLLLPLPLPAAAARTEQGSPGEASRGDPGEGMPPGEAGPPLARAAGASLAGAVAFALQVTWTRLLGEVLGASLLVLGISIAALLLGGAVASRWMPSLVMRRGGARILWGSWSCWFAAQALSALVIALLPLLYLGGVELLGAGGGGGAFLKGALLLAALVPPAVAGGVILPLLIAAGGRDERGLAREAGRLQACHLVGGTCGALGAGLAGIPLLGSGTMLAATAAVTLAAAAATALVPGFSRRSILLRAPLPVLAILAGLVLCMVARRHWEPGLLGAGVFQWSREDIAAGDSLESWRRREILYGGEGRLARVTLERAPDHNTVYLRVGGRVEGSVPIDPGAPSLADLPTGILLGLLPVLETGGAGRTLVIGLGGGTTAATLVEAAEGTVTILEVEEEVAAALASPAGRQAFPWEHRRLFPAVPDRAGRPRLRFDDGRAFLLREPGLWDAIVCQPSEPWLPWSAPLFTGEFFRLVRSRLRPGGVAVHWLQLYRIGAGEFAGILSAFRDAMGRVQVFHPPRTGEVILIGGGEPVPRSTWIDRWAAPALEPCLRRIPSLTAPPVPLLDEDGVSRWLARFPHRADRLRERLEFTLPLLGERGEDHSGEILRSLEDAAHRPARDRRGD